MHIPALVEHLESRTMLAGDLPADVAAALSSSSMDDVSALYTSFGDADHENDPHAEYEEHSLPLPNQPGSEDFHLLTCNCPICLATFARTSDETAVAGDGETLAGSYLPLTETFALHSNPGAKHTIYLDFDGHTTSGTLWNTFYTAGSNITSTPYSFEGGSDFSTSELQRIQSIWARVAEDFMPFDVNVTTEDPGTAALEKSGSSDTSWGVRVVIGGNHGWYGTAGGVAFIGSFNWDTDTPVFVFEDLLGNGNEKYTAEAITHEAGHALGLSHDGDATSNYYSGNGTWAPIMGTGYYAPLTQWSKGEYPGANNLEDDIQIIVSQNGFGYRADDFGNTISTATPLANQSGIISTRTDRDVFSFSTGGSVDITVNPAAFGPNLNVRAEILNKDGNVVVSADGPGLGATISTVLAAGDYYLRIDGVGDAAVGYSDYGSLGSYSIQADIQDPGPPPPPPPPPSSPPGLAINKTSLLLNESGTTDSFTLVLTSKPTANVYVTVRSLDETEGKPTTSTFVFTPSNWNVAQTVTVGGVDDSLYDGDRVYFMKMKSTSADVNYNFGESENPYVRATTVDNEGITGSTGTPGVTVSKKWLYVNESGTSDTFAVVLQSKPTANVTINVYSTLEREGTLNKSVLTFTPSNWNVAQTVTLTGVDDTIEDGDSVYFVKMSAVSADGSYDKISIPYLRAKTYDNDGQVGSTESPGVTVNKSWLYVDESGTSDSFTVVLQSQPTSNVTIRVRSWDESEGILDKHELIFTPSNWNSPQTVTLTGVDDSFDDGDRIYFVKMFAESLDASYDGISVPYLRAKTSDNDGSSSTSEPTEGREPVIDPRTIDMHDASPAVMHRSHVPEIDIDRYFQELPAQRAANSETIVWELEELLTSPV